MHEDFKEQNTMDFSRYSQRPKDSRNTTLIVFFATLSTMLLIAMIILVVVWTNGIKDEPQPPEPTVVPTATPAPTVVPTQKPNDESVINYYVRKSFDDVGTQIGAFHNYSNAVSYASQYASSGYEVYDKKGNLVYDPAPDGSSPSTAGGNAPSGGQVSTSNGIRYRVRKSAYDSASQIGAFQDLQNAIAHANSYKSQGYEVYDLNGNLIYAP